MAIVQSQWWYQYLSKKSARGGSRSSRDQHVDRLRVHPRMDVQDPDRNEQDLRQPGTILVCKKQINSSRWERQFQERVKQSAVRLNACSEQVTTQEETTPTVQLLQTQRKHLLTVHAGDHIFDHKKMKSPVHKDEIADLAEHIGVAWDDLTGSVLDCNEVWKARCKEFGYIHDKVVYKKIPRAGAQARGCSGHCGKTSTRETWRNRPTGAGSWPLSSTPVRWTDCSRPPHRWKL